MSTTEARPDVVGPDPETLALGPSAGDRRVTRPLLVLVVVAALALGSWAGWQRLRPPPDLTLAQLHRAYAGLVPAAGRHAVSTIDPATFTRAPLSVDPASCTPLFGTTAREHVPDPGIDGVSASWRARPDSVSLFTVRYASPSAATTAYRRVADAAAACEGRSVRFPDRGDTGRLEAVPHPVGGQGHGQLAYQLELSGRQGRYVLHLLRVDNTVSWQYRYQVRAGRYDPTPAAELMRALADQLRRVRTAGVRAAG